MHPTTIKLSKTKLTLLVVAACVFVAIGYWLLTLSAAEIETHRRFNNPLFVHGVGLASILFFGLAGVIGIRKLFDSAPGLIIDDQGITENTSVFSAGFIPWSDISGLEVKQIQNQRILYLLLKDPEKFIATCAPVKRVILKAAKGFAASPVAITSSSLKISFDDLVSAIDARLQRHRLNA